MDYTYCNHIAGTVDGRCGPFFDRLYLLNESFTVIGSRSNQERLAFGDRFFDCFKIDPTEYAALNRYLFNYDENNFLIQSDQGPVVMLTAFFRQTRTLLALVPPEEIGNILAAPAGYQESLAPLRLEFSPMSLARKKPITERGYRLISDFLLPFRKVLSFGKVENEDAFTILTVISFRIAHLAPLLGCLVSYDLSGIGYAPIKGANAMLLTDYMIAVFLLARRISVDHSVHLYLDREGTDDPVLHANMVLLSADDALTELWGLQAAANMRGALFEAELIPGKQRELHIRFTFCKKEISNQEVRNTLGVFGN